MKKQYYLAVFVFISSLFISESVFSQTTHVYAKTPNETIGSGEGDYDVDFDITDDFVIEDLNVTVNIEYDKDKDLNITLFTPDSFEIVLSFGNGGNGNDYKITTFDMNASRSITEGGPPFDGVFRPEGDLGGLKGNSSLGLWRLRVHDGNGGIDRNGKINQITLTFSEAPKNVTGYKGPGGVGENNGSSPLVLWLDASNSDNTNTLWKDISGYGFDFDEGNGAVLNTDDMNGYASYSFDGYHYFQRKIEGRLNPLIYDVFVVDRVTASSTFKSVLSSRDQGSTYRGFMLYSQADTDNWIYYTGDRNTDDWKGLGDNRSTAGTTSIQNITYNIIDYEKNLYIDNELNASDNAYYTENNSDYPFRVGAGQNESTPDYFFQGQISEVIMFDTRLNKAERIIVNNYLSSKYGSTLVADDFYNQDEEVNGDFDHNVAGIGQADDGSNHLDAQGSGAIRIKNPSDLNDNEFMFWGEETKDVVYSFTEDAPTYHFNLNSKWRVSEQGDLGTVSVSMDKSRISIIPSTSFARLAVSSTSDFSTKKLYALNDDGEGYLTATGVDFADGDYFTIEYFDYIVLDENGWYNGSGIENAPSNDDGNYPMLVKSTADGSISFTESPVTVRDVEIEEGGILRMKNALTTITLFGIEISFDAPSYLAVNNDFTNNGKIEFVENYVYGGVVGSVINLNSSLSSQGEILVENGIVGSILNGELIIENSSRSKLIMNNNSSLLCSKVINKGNIAFEAGASINGDVDNDGGTITFAQDGGESIIGGKLDVVSGDITLEDKTKVRINDINVETAGSFTIKSNDLTSTGTGLLITSGSVTGDATKYTVQRRIDETGSRWQLISSPVQSAQSGIFTGHFLNYYDEFPGDFKAIRSTTLPLNVGEGFVVKFDGTESILGTTGNPMLFNSTFNTGNVDRALEAGVGNTYFGLPAGFNLVGNPFPSNLDWDVVQSANSSVVDNALYYYVDSGSGVPNDPDNPPNNGTTLSNGWQTYIAGDGGHNQYVSIGQGFGVVLSTNSNATLTIPNSARTFGESAGFNKKQNTKQNYFELRAISKNVVDKVYYHVNDNATVNYDGRYDAYKLNSFGYSPTPSLISGDDKKLAVSESPFVKKIDVGFNMSDNGEVTFALSEADGFSEIVLEDKVTNTFTDLLKSEYTFTYSSNEEETGRFVLHLNKGTLGEQELTPDLKVYSVRKNVIINSTKELTNVAVNIYDTSGKLLISKTYPHLKSKEIKTNLPDGIFVLEMIFSDGVTKQKLILNN